MIRLFLFVLLLPNLVLAKLDIQNWQTVNGAKVYFLENHSLKMLDISLSFDAAASRDGDKSGLAKLTNSLIGMGSEKYSEEEIIAKFEQTGAEFTVNSLKDMAMVSLRTLSRKALLDSSLATFINVIAKPSFPKDKINRLKKQHLLQLKKNSQKPGSIASDEFFKLIFKAHPYQHNAIGNEKTINAITQDDIKFFFDKYYVAKNLTIAIVGDITKEKAIKIANNIASKFKTGLKPKKLNKVRNLNKAEAKHIEFPSKQSHLILGQPGVSREHKDYYHIYLANHILGGSGLTSLLSEEIREKKGLAYSVYSSMRPMAYNGFFLIKLQTKNSQLDDAYKTAIKTLNDFISSEIDDEIFNDAKNNIIDGFPLSIATNSDLITYLSIIGFYNLPLDYINSFADKIKKLTKNDVQRAFREMIDINKIIKVSVGKQKN